MTKILIGIDGSERGDRALEWACSYADEITQAGEEAQLTLLSIFTPTPLQGNLNEETIKKAMEDSLAEKVQEVAEKHPGLKAEGKVAKGGIVEQLADAANEQDMVVLGSHHGSTIGQTIGGARGLRVAIAVKVPTVVVPVDWEYSKDKTGIIVGVGLDTVSDSAVSFGVSEAKKTNQPLKLVTAWGLPAFLNKPAEVMGGGLGPVGEQAQQRLDARLASIQEQNEGLQVEAEAVEGSSPTRVLVSYSKDAKMLVLGTHSFNMLGRTLFGSVVHSVLLNLSLPTVVVPENSKA